MRANLNQAAGITFALFATFSWALNFVSPYVTGEYSHYDFILIRFILSGLIGLIFVILYRSAVAQVHARDVLVAAGLGMIGYVAYLACIMGGVVYAGPVIAPAFLGLVPVLAALMGNTVKKTVSWSALSIPVLLSGTGLLLANLGGVTGQVAAPASLVLGSTFSVGAVLCWLAFSFFNQRVFDRRPDLHSGAWTGLMMVGAAGGVLLLVPIGLQLRIFNFPVLGLGWDRAGSVYLWAFALAALSSVGGAWAWNIATGKLPMVLTGQLISVETLFAMLLGLLWHQRLPNLFEAVGIAMVVAGAILAVRTVLTPSNPVVQRTGSAHRTGPDIR